VNCCRWFACFGALWHRSFKYTLVTVFSFRISFGNTQNKEVTKYTRKVLQLQAQPIGRVYIHNWSRSSKRLKAAIRTLSRIPQRYKSYATCPTLHALRYRFMTRLLTKNVDVSVTFFWVYGLIPRLSRCIYRVCCNKLCYKTGYRTAFWRMICLVIDKCNGNVNE